MSMQARLSLVNSNHTIFTPEQRADFLDLSKTSTNLVAFLLEMIGKGHIIQFTAVRSDHHDDTGLNPTPPHSGTHGAGFAVDCWPLTAFIANEWVDARSADMQEFLRDAARSPWLKQIGLAGDADNFLDEIAAGGTWFPDSGASHIHLGVHA
jgi:hypothetical protein